MLSPFPAPIILNTLGDLTNRENRFAHPRFANDFVVNSTGVAGPDGFPDDLNGDGVADFYPTLYYDAGNGNVPFVFAPGYSLPAGGGFATMAFPYIYPGAYTKPENDPNNTRNVGYIHSPTPDQVVKYPYYNDPLHYLQRLNHNPLDVGDNLFRPDDDRLRQTWWGFPTWRETLSPGWVDPTVQVNVVVAQPSGLTPRSTTNVVGSDLSANDDAELLPPMSTVNGIVYRKVDQLFSDGFGSNSNIITGANNPAGIPASNNANLWAISWEDDLIMTGVRSFDIKAYDDLYGGFVDLGWGDDVRLLSPPLPVPPNYFLGTPTLSTWGGRTVDTLASTFAHEGRMPPLVEDNRFDAQFGQQYYPGTSFTGYTGNIGNNSPPVGRLRRVWDSWSTDYTNAPANANGGGTAAIPYGPPYTPPIYPSYPPPYPAPLRGIQIQIRVVDPTNQRVKQMTIRHDFTDKL